MLTEQQRRELDWEKTDGLMPAIVQHAVSGEVLMLGYMNPQALDKTIESGHVTFFSRTKQRLWTKGETSGHVLNVVSIAPDCDNDTLLVLANPVGPTCHKGTSSCFGDASHQWLFLYQLEQLLAERKTADPTSSYTAKLYASGTKRIAQKVGEEGVETALAATVNDRFELTNEASDLMYHLLVLLQDQDLNLHLLDIFRQPTLRPFSGSTHIRNREWQRLPFYRLFNGKLFPLFLIIQHFR